MLRCQQFTSSLKFPCIGRRFMASLVTTYFLWFVGGFFGLHHMYLGRTSQAVLYVCTFGGFLLGWLRDFYRIPEYVRQCNSEPMYLAQLRSLMKRRPQGTMTRAISMYCFGYMLACISLGPFGPFEPAGTLLNITSVNVSPKTWVFFCDFISSIGVITAISIINSIGGHYTANFSYIYLATLAGSACDFFCACYWDSPSIFCLRLVIPIFVYLRVCEWVPASADPPLRLSHNKCSRFIRALCITLLALCAMIACSSMYVFHYFTVDVEALQKGDVLSATEPVSSFKDTPSWWPTLFEDDAEEGENAVSHGDGRVVERNGTGIGTGTDGEGVSSAGLRDSRGESGKKAKTHGKMGNRDETEKKGGVVKDAAPQQGPQADRKKERSEKEREEKKAEEEEEEDVDWEYFFRNVKNSGRMRVKDVLYNVFQSQWWSDFTAELSSAFQTWKTTGHINWDVFDFSDIDWSGLDLAAKTLNVTVDMDMKTIMKQKRQLHKKWHPDRYSTPQEKLIANEKFNEVQKSFETIVAYKKSIRDEL